jgi:hypothetical protein
MAYLDAGGKAAPTTTKTAKALKAGMAKRDKVIAKARATGDPELLEFAMKNPVTSLKAARRGLLELKADAAQYAGDSLLAKGYRAMAAKKTKVV